MTQRWCPFVSAGKPPCPIRQPVSCTAGQGTCPAMIAFFVILALLMVFVVMAGQWSAGARRRVIYDRDVVVDRRPDVIEEEVVDDPYPVARSRRVVRRRRY